MTAWLTSDQLRHFHFGTDEPVLLSVSGGRTSGFMLWATLQAYGGSLPDNIHVVFFNTGKEFEETLRFVHEQAVRWGVRITWLEFDPNEPFQTGVVGLNSASRNGEPFEAVIRERGMLPNPVASICSQYLKVKRGIAYMRDMLGLESWLNVIGLRHDEPRRVAKQLARNEGSKEAFETVIPLHSARITRRHVSTFWKAQPFDLGLPDIDGKTPLGNLRGPELATFRADRPTYRQMWEYIQDQGDIEDDGEESLPCGCHD